MTLISRLCCICLVCFISACASSGVQAPVVGSAVGNDANQPANVYTDAPVNSDSYIQSSPLPSSDPLEQQPIQKKRERTSPVLRNLLAKAETARAQKDWIQSEVYLERALRIESKNALVWHRLALLKLQQSKNNQAIQFASKSNTLARGDGRLKRNNWSVIAEANTALNRPVKADEARRKSQGY